MILHLRRYGLYHTYHALAYPTLVQAPFSYTVSSCVLMSPYDQHVSNMLYRLCKAAGRLVSASLPLV